MVLRLDQFNVMEYLWDTLPKTEDGRLNYGEGDIRQLYELGFVDTEAFTLEQWLDAFEPVRQMDGTYLLNRDEFLALDKYRYKGEIRIPFDAMEINEGKYTDEGLEDLIHASIMPSCGLPKEEQQKFYDALKKEFRQGDGLILIKKPAKERIRALLNASPSPLRRLEVMLDGMIKTQLPEFEKQVDEAISAGDAATAARQRSTFSDAPTTRVEAKALGLKALQQARRTEASTEIEGAPKTELKKIRRSRKGMRG